MRAGDGPEIGAILEELQQTRIHLCGRFTVRWAGRRVEDELPGKQGRFLFAFLAINRHAPTTRASLMEALWTQDPPPAAESALAALIAKLRRSLGESAVVGRHELHLELPSGAWLDVECAADALHRAESAVAAGDWTRAWGPARVVMHIAARSFLVGHDSPWIERVRQQLGNALVRSHECVAEAGLGIGGAELITAERAARRLVVIAPLNERGWRLLMRIVARQGNPAEALMLFEELRTVLREQLGTGPSIQSRDLHRALLQGENT